MVPSLHPLPPSSSVLPVRVLWWWSPGGGLPRDLLAFSSRALVGEPWRAGSTFPHRCVLLQGLAPTRSVLSRGSQTLNPPLTTGLCQRVSKCDT